MHTSTISSICNIVKKISELFTRTLAFIMGSVVGQNTMRVEFLSCKTSSSYACVTIAIICVSSDFVVMRLDSENTALTRWRLKTTYWKSNNRWNCMFCNLRAQSFRGLRWLSTTAYLRRIILFNFISSDALTSLLNLKHSCRVSDTWMWL